jgi:hypothetical protein
MSALWEDRDPNRDLAILDLDTVNEDSFAIGDSGTIPRPNAENNKSS